MALHGGGHLELKKMHKGDFWGIFGIRLGRCPCIIHEKISFLQFYSRFNPNALALYYPVSTCCGRRYIHQVTRIKKCRFSIRYMVTLVLKDRISHLEVVSPTCHKWQIRPFKTKVTRSCGVAITTNKTKRRNTLQCNLTCFLPLLPLNNLL